MFPVLKLTLPTDPNTTIPVAFKFEVEILLVNTFEVVMFVVVILLLEILDIVEFVIMVFVSVV